MLCLVKLLTNNFLHYFSAYTKRHLVLHYTLRIAPHSAFSEETGHFSKAIYTPTITALWCRYGVGPTSLTSDLWEASQKCASWLTARAEVRPLWHLVLSQTEVTVSSALLWKLTAKHSQLDLCYLERLSSSPGMKEKKTPYSAAN